jgi:hypothetical protein
VNIIEGSDVVAEVLPKGVAAKHRVCTNLADKIKVEHFKIVYHDLFASSPWVSCQRSVITSCCTQHRRRLALCLPGWSNVCRKQMK